MAGNFDTGTRFPVDVPLNPRSSPLPDPGKCRIFPSKLNSRGVRSVADHGDMGVSLLEVLKQSVSVEFPMLGPSL